MRNISPMVGSLRQARLFCSKPTSRHPGIQMFSCRARNKVPLELPSTWVTSFYTCGPTVYDSAHIGHASCYVRLDILQRILKDHFRMNLVTAMNITDIDDKIIKRANETGQSWTNIARHYEEEFWSDLRSLNVRLPDIKLRVTDHIPNIIAFIKRLITDGFAYKTSDGSIYFETAKFPQYGKLQNIPAVQETSVEGKKNAADFALWKAVKPGEPSWESSFGPGRPGWHIECSTLASHIFGRHIDFHAGGLDLRFPHHENEEAQSCCYHQVNDWVRHWIHTGQLHLEGQTHKMSKSLKNTVSIRELLEQFSSDEFRMLCLLSHYRNVIEYGDESMTVATNVLRKFRSFFNDSRAYIGGIKPAASIDGNLIRTKLDETDVKIDGYLRNDFNTASAVAQLGDLASLVNKSINQKTSDVIDSSESGTIQAVGNYIRSKLNLFGLLEFKPGKVGAIDVSDDGSKLERVFDGIMRIRSSIRKQAITNKDQKLFAVCDQIRNQLKELDVEIKDHGETSSWNYMKR